MVKLGFVLPKAGKDAFRPIWCAWGYGRGFTPSQVEATLPLARRLGFGWATLDDGWQVAEGDWVPVSSKFPSADADMKALVAFGDAQRAFRERALSGAARRTTAAYIEVTASVSVSISVRRLILPCSNSFSFVAAKPCMAVLPLFK